ncbi:MAG: hypothetical protein ACRYGR_03355 [Janthinobacterium lividum]
MRFAKNWLSIVGLTLALWMECNAAQACYFFEEEYDIEVKNSSNYEFVAMEEQSLKKINHPKIDSNLWSLVEIPYRLFTKKLWEIKLQIVLNSRRILLDKLININWNNLPDDIFFHYILPHCDVTIIQVNRRFFTLVTGYPYQDINKTGFGHLPIKPVCNLLQKRKIDFSKFLLANGEYKTIPLSIEKIPSFLWYSLCGEINKIPQKHWMYVEKSQICRWKFFIFDFPYFNKITPSNIQEIESSIDQIIKPLKAASQLHTLDLVDTGITLFQLERLIKGLTGSSIKVLYLSDFIKMCDNDSESEDKFFKDGFLKNEPWKYTNIEKVIFIDWCIKI